MKSIKKLSRNLGAVCVAFSILFWGTGAWAQSTVVSVPGTACIYMAGQSAFAAIDEDDFVTCAPTVVSVSGAQSIRITASGSSAHGTNPSHASGPEGTGTPYSTDPTYEQYGISVLGFPIGGNTLIGVFLSDAVPNPANLPPRLAQDTDRPGLHQAFRIGAGPVTIYPPSGATKLFLGTHDAFGWAGNLGQFQVSLEMDSPSYWIDGTVSKVIWDVAQTVIAIRPSAGGELLYLGIAGDDMAVNRALAIAMMAQSNGMTVHVRISETADQILTIATVEE